MGGRVAECKLQTREVGFILHDFHDFSCLSGSDQLLCLAGAHASSALAIWHCIIALTYKPVHGLLS